MLKNILIPHPQKLMSLNDLKREISTSQKLYEKLTCRAALNAALDEELQHDERVFILGEEVAEYDGAYKVTKGLWKKYGSKRVIDTPITEQGFTGLAIGAAFCGLRPVCEFMTWNFCMQAIDHVVNSAGKTFYMSAGRINVPITFRGPDGVSPGVAAQHTQCFGSWLSHCPGLKVVAPYSATDCKGLLKSAIRDPDPVVFLECEILYGKEFPVSSEAMKSDYLLPLGKGHIERPGNDITLVSFSQGVETCLLAADILSKDKNISCEVINLRSLRPIDLNLVFQSVKKTHFLITVEKDWARCGIGAEISAAIMESPIFFELDAPVIRLTNVDVPMPYASFVESAAMPSPQDIVKAVLKVLGKK